ncbi:MAG: alpha/beta hydrolase [Chthoniobacterales bacterium]
MKEIIKNAAGENIDYTFATGEKSAHHKGWLVILGHGLTGNKDRPLITEMADALNQAGFDTLRFSFSGNGDSEGDFRDSNITKGDRDLKAIVSAASKNYTSLCYLGHSMGSASGVLRASQDVRLNCLISLAGIVQTESFAKKEFGGEIPDEGFMWEDENAPLSQQFMDDLCKKIRNIVSQAKGVSIPWLLVHGNADETVNPNDSNLIKTLKADAVDLVVVRNADHSFTKPAHKQKAIDAVVTWLTQRTHSAPK